MSSLSNSNNASQPPPPPPPPLPHGNRAANAIARLAQPFIYGSRPPSTEGNRSHDHGLKSGISCLKQSRGTTHKTGIPIAALDISPGLDFAVLAGRDILKTIRVSDSSCSEHVNLRSEILNHASTQNPLGGPTQAKHRDHLAANDVKWSHGQFDTTIATAVANGQIVIYDINRADVESARLHEHNRQVHRLAFNPYNPAYLISGSQDATVRLWDLRALDGQRSVMNFGSASSYSLNNEGIRDIKWSPRDAVEFAAGTDNGVIQRWDFRKQTSPLLKINAHEKTCQTIDWHPDGKHLASGGADKNVKVWDFSSTDRRMKVCWQLRAPQAIRQVRWRPPCAKTDSHSSTHVPCTQIATAYDHQDPRIHVWDFRRSYLPFQEIHQYETSATAMLWHSEDLLWSVGLDGIFTQTDLRHTSKVIDQRSPNVLSIASGGTLSFFSEQREARRMPNDEAPSDFSGNRHETISTGERLSGSQSVTDGSFEESSFLSSSFKSRQLRPPASKSTKFVGTPPSANDGEYLSKLEEALQKEYIYRPEQSAAIGNIAGIFDAEAFGFLARNYRLPPTRPSSCHVWDLHIMLPRIFDENALLAGSVGQHRLAQSWRILGLALGKDLKRRAENAQAAQLRLPEASNDLDLVPYEYTRNETRLTDLSFLTADNLNPAKSVQKRLPSVTDNESNVTTPLARPVSLANGERQRHVAILNHDDVFHLPDPAFTKQSPRRPLQMSSDLTRMKNTLDTKQNEPVTDPPITTQCTEQPPQNDGPTPPVEFPDLEIDMNERRAAINNYRAQPRPLLRLDDPFQLPRDYLVTSPGRHNSDESFQLFSASTDSSHRTPSVSGSYQSSRESGKSDSSPERQRLGGRHGSLEHSKGWQNTNTFPKGSQSPKGLRDSLTPSSSAQGLLQALQCSPHAVEPTILRPQNLGPPQIHVEDFADTIARDKTPSDGISRSQLHFIRSDFVPDDEPFLLKPWTTTTMLRPLIDYHINSLSDKQMPAFLILYLAPYLSLSIPPTLMAAILLEYHDQLTSLSLYCEAAHLRKANEDTHSEIAEHGTYGITPGGPWCTVCQKVSKGDQANFCERCMNTWDPCPICNGEGQSEPLLTKKPIYSKFGNDNMLWGWCQVCGHGGHLGCLRTWWDDPVTSEGGCATIGCLHDCVDGTRRDELLSKVAEGKKAGVAGDEWVVSESKAVEKARKDLMIGGDGQGGRRGQAGGRGRTRRQAPLLAGRSGSGSSNISTKVRLLVPQSHEGSEGEVAASVAASIEEGRGSASAP